MTTDSLKGRTAIVTGGGTGIGLEISRNLARRGARVAITSRNQENLDSGQRQIQEDADHEIFTVPSNVRDPDDVESMVSAVAEHVGPPTILVNNAAADFVCRAEELSPNGWRAIQETVLWGGWFCSTAVAPYMFAAGGGAICNILSTVVISGAPGRSHSAAAKAGMAAVTRSLAIEWSDRGVRVTGVAPGPVDTKGAREHVFGDKADEFAAGLPLRRMATPAEVAETVGFLCSPQASYITGEIVTVDGAVWITGAQNAPGPGRLEPEAELKQW